jgi:hypothetical protein
MEDTAAANVVESDALFHENLAAMPYELENMLQCAVKID